MVSSRKPSLQATRPKPRFSLSRGFFNFGTSGSLNGFESWGGLHAFSSVGFRPWCFFLDPLNARGDYNRFESYGGERGCACIGTSGCSQMKASNSCKSEPICDNGLGAIVCSCSAANKASAETLGE